MQRKTWFAPTSNLNRRQALQLAAGVGLLSICPVGHRRSWGQDDPPLPAYKKLQVLSANPLNAEPDARELVQTYITPKSLFYIRSHAPAPKINPPDFRLEVDGLVDRPLSLSLEELQQRFLPVQVVATLTCAGNRRNELSAIRAISGVQWGPGAIGNAEWGGVRLADVLRRAGVQEGGKHVWFEGLDAVDHDGETAPFGGSIPLDVALRNHRNVPGAILATTMNGEPLETDHGFPLRSVVPGFIGARSVKWLGRITVSDRPSPNHYVQDAYKLIQEQTPEAVAAADPLYEFALNSAIAAADSRTFPRGRVVELHGYALPSGAPGCMINKVELSVDNGRSWQRARLQSSSNPFCWQLWSARLRLDGDAAQKVYVRATDSCGTSQPQELPWNAKGYMNNGWHSVELAQG